MRKTILLCLIIVILGAGTQLCLSSDSFRFVFGRTVEIYELAANSYERVFDIYDLTATVPLPDTFIGENVALVENIWRVMEVTHRGEKIAFDTIAPITIVFKQWGILVIRTTGCHTFGYKIFTGDKRRYELVSGFSMKRHCARQNHRQLNRVDRVIKVTNAYEIQGNQLILTGDGVQIILETDK